MSDFRADLHCHTNFSDGTDTPEEVIVQAVEKGLSGLSITDHDTIAAYPEALVSATRHGIMLLPGIEFSASDQGESVHILGYAFSLQSEALQILCARHRKRREERNLVILERLRGLGIHISEAEIAPTGKAHTVGRPHIALALMHKGIVGSIREAFMKYLGEGKPAYYPGHPVSVEETLETIHQAKGKAILAHPHLIRRRSSVRRLLTFPFDGLEGYYARFGPDKEREWVELARSKGWILTGGSDYHGANKPHNELGSSWVGQETFDDLYRHYEQVAGSKS